MYRTIMFSCFFSHKLSFSDFFVVDSLNLFENISEILFREIDLELLLFIKVH